jgi:hypothetical protein
LNGIVEDTIFVRGFLSFGFSVPKFVFQTSFIENFILPFGVELIDLALNFGHEKLLVFGDFLFKLNVNSGFLLLRMRLISEESDGSFLKGDFPVEGVFHVQERVIFVEILLVFKDFIVEVEADVFFVLESFLLFSEVAVNVFVVLSFFKEFSFFA